MTDENRCIDCNTPVKGRAQRCQPCKVKRCCVYKREQRRLKRETALPPRCDRCGDVFERTGTRQKFCIPCGVIVMAGHRKEYKARKRGERITTPKVRGSRQQYTTPDPYLVPAKPAPAVTPLRKQDANRLAKKLKREASSVAAIRWLTGDEADAAARFAELVMQYGGGE